MNSTYKTLCLRLWMFICCFASFTAVAADSFEKVKSDIKAGRMEIALQALQATVEKHPGDYEAWFLMGVANAREQRYHRAIEAFRRVTELNTTLAEPHNNLAVIYNELGDVRAAVDELEQSLKKRPGYAIAEGNLADLYVKLALENYRSALEKEPNPLLEKRYARLLQVRDPTAVPKNSVASVPVVNEAVVNDPVINEVAVNNAVVDSSISDQGIVASGAIDAAVDSAQSNIEQVEVLPEKLSVIDADVENVPAESAEQAVMAAIEQWRAAWSSRDLAAYFASYAEDYQVPERFPSLGAWQTYKQRVISSKSYIEVELNDLRVEVDDGGQSAVISFLQKFRSDSYNGDDAKLLNMKLEYGTWKIVKEESI